jgi:hypothetical protein
VTPLEPATHQMVDSPHSCRVEDGMAPTTAFSRFPHVHRADVEGKQRVDLPRSPCRRAITAICAFLPSRGGHPVAPSRSGVSVFPFA